MIESRYWKEELARIAGDLAPVSKPPRWSERAHCVLERDLMIGFFIVRRLIELNKVSTLTGKGSVSLFSYAAVGTNVTRLNSHEIEALYDMGREVPARKSTYYVSNQFIHAYTSFIERDEGRNWSDVLVVSDRARNDCIWLVPVPEIRRVFMVAASDYPHSVTMAFNDKTGDYDVETN